MKKFLLIKWTDRWRPVGYPDLLWSSFYDTFEKAEDVRREILDTVDNPDHIDIVGIELPASPRRG